MLSGKTTASSIVLMAGCKINLFLRVTGRRTDGYHTLDSIFWPLDSPCDSLAVTKTTFDGLQFSCSEPDLETPNNIVVKAYEAFVRKTSFAPKLSVHLQKNIPFGAGLGGGSSDAAALLLYLNQSMLAETATCLADAELTELGAHLGADVPFFFSNTPSRISGIGEVVTPLSKSDIDVFSGLHLVLVCLRVHVATAWAFNVWDEKNPMGCLTNENENDTSPLVQRIRIQNDLSQVVFERYPVIQETVALLEQFNAVASMSGSGSSVFGLFRNKYDAENAIRYFCQNGERVFYHIL